MFHLYSLLPLACLAKCQPANVLCALDRGGKARSFKPKNFKEAQLKLTDFGVSRVLALSSSKEAAVTATVSLDMVNHKKGIAGTQAYMHPKILSLVDAITKGEKDDDLDIDAELLFANDSFGVGCVVAYLCSGGIHPFASGARMNIIPSNIQAHRRVKLGSLKISDSRHTELVDHLTTWKDNEVWTVTTALRLSSAFNQGAPNVGDDTLMEQLAFLKPPSHSCEDELLAPQLVEICPLLPEMMANIREAVQRLVSNEALLPKALDINSCVLSSCGHSDAK